MRICTQKLSTLTICVLISFAVSVGLLYLGRNRKRWVKSVCFPLFLVSLYGVLKCSVLGRTPTDKHVLTFWASYSNEFGRELFMNALLYYPFGLTLTGLIGPWSILVAFLLSVVIEVWQFSAGTGLAQGTDVIMNTVGCAVGALPWLAFHLNRSSASGSDL